jgi:hypothetical protein
MQKGRWVDQFGLRIVPFEDRPDAARWQGGPIYRVKDVFTTRDGSWEVSDTPGSIDQWAKDAYWSGAKFDGAGGDHNFFILALDEAGQPIPGKGLLFWQGEMTADFKPSDPRTAKQDGSENIPVFGSYIPERGEHGSWSGAALGKSDVLVGVGMPANWHISTFLVLQAVAAPVVPPPASGDTAAILQAIADVAEQVQRLSKHLGL